MPRAAVQVGRVARRGDSRVGRIISQIILCLAIMFAVGAMAAALLGDWPAVIVFAWGVFVSGVCAGGARVAFIRTRIGGSRAGLLMLTVLYLLGPVALAVPFFVLVPGNDLVSAYFEAASALTTTGASAIRDLDSVPQIVVFWRALIAGVGGFLCLTAAVAIMAPLSIGGFEVESGIGARDGMGQDDLSSSAWLGKRGIEARVLSAINWLGIPYLAVLILVTLALAALDVPAFEAICLALAVVSTTGFVPVADGLSSYDSFLVEAILIVAMLIAAVGVATHLNVLRGRWSAYRHDPELRYLGIFVLIVISVIFLRHWIGAIETRSTDELGAAIDSLWGALFMAVSFVTTTGLESATWQDASTWSGLDTPGIMLIGLAIIGGGAASTAGGVKLIRAALMAKHSLNELNRLAHPSSLRLIRSGGRVVGLRSLRIVFVFVMLYVLALAGCALGLAACGVDIVDALTASIAAVSNTGPVFPLIEGGGDAFANLPPIAKMILCIAMVVGRMETLAVVAVLSPSGWRN